MEWLAPLAAVVGVLIGHILGSRSQVAAEVREKRREMYLSWLRFIDKLPLEGRRAIVEQRQDAYMDAVWDRLSDITTEIDIYASKEVMVAWNKVREALATDEIEKAILDAVRNRQSETQGRFDIAWQLVHREHLKQPRDELFKAMRRDIGTWKRSYDR